MDGALLMLLESMRSGVPGTLPEAIVQTVTQPLLVLTRDLKIQSANLAFYKAFKVRKEETKNRLIYDLGR